MRAINLLLIAEVTGLSRKRTSLACLIGLISSLKRREESAYRPCHRNRRKPPGHWRQTRKHFPDPGRIARPGFSIGVYADADIATARDAGAGIRTDGRVVVASGVVTKCVKPDGGVARAVRIALERVRARSGIDTAISVAKKRLHTGGRVFVAGRVVPERTKPIGRVVVASGIVEERRIPYCRVPAALQCLSIAHYPRRLYFAHQWYWNTARIAVCRVEAAFSIAIERECSGRRVTLADGVEQKRSCANGCIVGAGAIEQKALPPHRRYCNPRCSTRASMRRCRYLDFRWSESGATSSRGPCCLCR